MKVKGGEKLKEERLNYQKEERLKNLKEIFKETIEDTIKDVKKGMNTNSKDVVNAYVEAVSNQLVYEVRIRINKNFITKNNMSKEVKN